MMSPCARKVKLNGLNTMMSELMTIEPAPVVPGPLLSIKPPVEIRFSTCAEVSTEAESSVGLPSVTSRFMGSISTVPPPVFTVPS